MANLVYICIRRPDLPNGVVQVLDLWPNVSQRNAAIDPQGQTKYLHQAYRDLVTTYVGGGGAILASTDLRGIGAYLIDHVEALGLAAGTAAMTFAEANTAQTAILVRLFAGNTLTLADINAILTAACGGGTELTNAGGSNSTGSLAELLKVCAGALYTVPQGSVLDLNGATFNPAVSGTFAASSYRDTVLGAPFEISNLMGTLSKWRDPTYTYHGITAPAVVCYDGTGAVLT